jgi:choline kinase
LRAVSARLGKARSAKPLTVIAGLSLVERSIATAHGAGADAFVVVCGAHCDQLVGHLDEIARRRSLIVTPVLNPRFAEGNGRSVLAARELLDAEERFLLVMADHVLDPRLLTDLVADRPATGEVVMAVDRAVNDPGVDPGKATRVWVWGDRVGTIGEGLQPYNGFDTGAFVCTPVVFEAVERGKRTPRRRH